jgi:copper chaperone
MTDFKVDGMTCGGCAAAVERAIQAAAPAAKVKVDLLSGRVSVDNADDALVVQAVTGAGFEVVRTGP